MFVLLHHHQSSQFDECLQVKLEVLELIQKRLVRLRISAGFSVPEFCISLTASAVSSTETTRFLISLHDLIFCVSESSVVVIVAPKFC